MRRIVIHLLIVAAGAAALGWEVIWQLKSSLSLGVSARGTAITLASTMGGMTAGSVLMGRFLRGREIRRPLRTYGLLELAIGLCGQLLLPAFAWIEKLDAAIYALAPSAAPFVHLAAIVLLLGPPALAMGASIPLFGLVAREYRSSIAVMYGFNTGGAAAGVLLVTFFVLPALGVQLSIGFLAFLNCLVCLAAWLVPAGAATDAGGLPKETTLRGESVPYPPRLANLIVFGTGFATFALEVAWFRSLRAAYQSTTDSFAIMLAAVLIPLAAAAHLVPWLQRRGLRLEYLLAGAGALILLATPLIERFDILTPFPREFWHAVPAWLALSLAVLGPPVLLLGTALPWLLQQSGSPSGWARLYAFNTSGAIAGSLAAAWLMLPSLGFARTSWLVALLVAILAIRRGGGRFRFAALSCAVAALAVAVAAESGVGRTRINGRLDIENYRVLEFHEGPDSTVSAIEAPGDLRLLYVDGFETAGERRTSHYMSWMGRLPMLLHPDPRDALVICFGTGQTVNGVRREGPEHIDAVDINRAVFDMAPLFTSNQDILNDPRVRTVVMDGRAWLRRTSRRYDVITLEPMPPNFAGVNALYSREFYELVRDRLQPGGVTAQWLPFHLVHPFHSSSIAATFRAVFPDSLLWIDPVGLTGILVGRREAGNAPLGADWPGLERNAPGRSLAPGDIVKAIRLDSRGMERYGSTGAEITDDNQLLAYGRTRWRMLGVDQRGVWNIQAVDRAQRGE